MPVMSFILPGGRSTIFGRFVCALHVLILIQVFSGCAHVIKDPAFPGGFSSSTTLCPRIDGTFDARGRRVVIGGINCPKIDQWKGSEAGEWDCRMDLPSNLGLKGYQWHSTEALFGIPVPSSGPVPIVRIRQIDDETVGVAVVVTPDSPEIKHTLARGKDYQCADGRLVFDGAASICGSSWMTIGCVLGTAGGGVQRHVREFRLDTAGNLVMTVRENRWHWAYFFFFEFTGSTHVIWSSMSPPGLK